MCPDHAKGLRIEKIKEKQEGYFTHLIEIIISVLAIFLFVNAISFTFRITWGAAKIAATILMILAVPIFIVWLIFAGGFVLLFPIALIISAIGLLKNCK